MRGVDKTPQGMFKARIKYKGQLISLGNFTEATTASAVYAEARCRVDAGLPPLPDRPMGPLTELESFRATYHYNPNTGFFEWLCKKTGRRTGRRAGGKLNTGYRALWLGSRLYLEHRVAWLMLHGAWPSLIDHANLIKDDNRVSNLREATVAMNNANRRIRSDSTTGVKGVSLRPDKGRKKRYHAAIRKHGKSISLGSYETMAEASAAYRQAALDHFGEFART